MIDIKISISERSSGWATNLGEGDNDDDGER